MNSIILPDHIFKWLMENQYEEDEIKEFYAEWPSGDGLSRQDFLRFIQFQFDDNNEKNNNDDDDDNDNESRDRTAEIDWLQVDDGLYQFEDFLKFMDRFESVTLQSE